MRLIGEFSHHFHVETIIFGFLLGPERYRSRNLVRAQSIADPWLHKIVGYEIPFLLKLTSRIYWRFYKVKLTVRLVRTKSAFYSFLPSCGDRRFGFLLHLFHDLAN